MKNCGFLFLLLVFLFVVYSDTKGIFENFSYVTRNGNLVTIFRDSMQLMCTQNLNMDFNEFNQTLSVKTVVIIWCLPPKKSYNEVLGSYNVNISAIKKLHLNFQNEPLVLTKQHFNNLEIEELQLYNDGFPLNIKFLDDFMEPLDTLKTLVVDKIAFPPLSEHVNVKTVVLRNAMSLGDFGRCERMEELHLIYWEIPRGSKNWLTNCTSLHILKMDRISEITLSLALEGAQIQNILNLTMIRCDLTQFPVGLLEKATSLKHLDLSHNYLNNIGYDDTVWLQSLKDLESLDLSYNELHLDGFSVLFVAEVTATTHKMKYISIANNHLEPRKGTCDEDGISRFSIKRLSYAYTDFPEIKCLSQYILDDLEYIDLTNNNIGEVHLSSLPSSNSHYVADLQNNPLHTIVFDRKDYENFVQNASANRIFTIHMDSLLDCDCNHAWYARALQEKITFAIGAKCNDDDQTELINKPQNALECIKTEDEGCTFRESWKDETVVAICNNTDIDKLPTGKRFSIIYAADNEIDVIRKDDLPPTLKFLDLRRNSISRVDEDVAEVMFNHSRHLLLHGNPILCSCNNKHFIKQLQMHHFQVDDYDNLTCAGEALSISEVDSDDLCSLLPLIPMVSGGTLLSLLVLTYIICRMYGRDIKMFLYTHGWCLCCVTETDLDHDREYDAFISFSHQDFDIVNDQLIPGLEPEFKLCLHYRDWSVGEWIPAQIQTSILKSKRTIIILSKNYLESVWGMFEFRMSFALALKEGRMRIIIILLENLNNEEMAPDLSNFVSNNTYLKWEDPWFWQKLKYALPHKINRNKNTQSNEDNTKTNHPCSSIVLRQRNNVAEYIVNEEEMTV